MERKKERKENGGKGYFKFDFDLDFRGRIEAVV